MRRDRTNNHVRTPTRSRWPRSLGPPFAYFQHSNFSKSDFLHHSIVFRFDELFDGDKLSRFPVTTFHYDSVRSFADEPHVLVFFHLRLVYRVLSASSSLIVQLLRKMTIMFVVGRTMLLRCTILHENSPSRCSVARNDVADCQLATNCLDEVGRPSRRCRTTGTLSRRKRHYSNTSRPSRIP